jgi:hypothetical protein
MTCMIEEQSLTSPGFMVGTFAHMWPEPARAKELDPRGDLPPCPANLPPHGSVQTAKAICGVSIVAFRPLLEWLRGVIQARGLD